MNWRSVTRLSLTLIGFASLALGGVGLAAEIGYDLNTELPLGDPRGIAVDAQGNIYVGLQRYSRIQVYDAQGRYLYGFSFYASRGRFWMRLNEYDRLEVAIQRTTTLYVFTKEGKLLRTMRQSIIGARTYDYEFHDPRDDATYVIVPALFRPSVVRIDAHGNRKVVVQTPLAKGLCIGPFPTFFWWMFGSCMLGIARSKYLRQ